MFFPCLLLVVSTVFSFPAVDDSRATGNSQTNLTKTGEIHTDTRSETPKPSQSGNLCKGKPIKPSQGKRKPLNLKTLSQERNETAEKLTAYSAHGELEVRAKKISLGGLKKKSNTYNVTQLIHGGYDAEISPKELVYVVFDYDGELSEEHMRVHG